MKKTISILLLVLLIAGVIISCDNKVKATSSETVSVSFVESSSRDLTVEHQAFNVNDLYWKYAAQKADSSGLSQGETTSYDVNGAKWIKPSSDNTDLPSAPGYGVVGGFSQGLWKFTLYGFTKVGDTNVYKLVVSGESKTVNLKIDNNNKVTVNAAPVSSSETGTLTITKIGFISDKENQSTVGDRLMYNVDVTKASGEPHGGQRSGDVYTLDPGAYKATISYFLGGDPNKYTFARGTKLVQVWSNQNTTIKGSLNELITSADFSAIIDPLVLFASTDTSTRVGDNKYSSTGKYLTYMDEATSHKLILEIPTTVAQYYISDYKDTSSTRVPNKNDEINFTASVETTAISDSSVTYNIALDYSVKPTYASKYQGPSKIAEINSSLPSVTITLAIDQGLTINQVSILNDVNLGKNDNVDELKLVDTGYCYNSEHGLLYIKTRKLGDFVVTYTR